jgi:hypothetical protein
MEQGMSARVRKLIGMFGILAFMGLYIGAAAWIGDRLPETPLVKLVYFIVAGSAWFVPLIPLVRWMNSGR